MCVAVFKSICQFPGPDFEVVLMMNQALEQIMLWIRLETNVWGSQFCAYLLCHYEVSSLLFLAMKKTCSMEVIVRKGHVNASLAKWLCKIDWDIQSNSKPLVVVLIWHFGQNRIADLNKLGQLFCISYSLFTLGLY